MNQQLYQRFEAALNTEQALESLQRLAKTLRDEGVSQIELYQLYASYQERTSGDDPNYDAIVDVMDFIYGGPWAKGGDLYPTQLTDEIISRIIQE